MIPKSWDKLQDNGALDYFKVLPGNRNAKFILFHACCNVILTDWLFCDGHLGSYIRGHLAHGLGFVFGAIGLKHMSEKSQDKCITNSLPSTVIHDDSADSIRLSYILRSAEFPTVTI